MRRVEIILVRKDTTWGKIARTIIQMHTWYTASPVTAECDSNSPTKVDWEEISKPPVTENHLSHWSYSKNLGNAENKSFL